MSWQSFVKYGIANRILWNGNEFFFLQRNRIRIDFSLIQKLWNDAIDVKIFNNYFTITLPPADRFVFVIWTGSNRPYCRLELPWDLHYIWSSIRILGRTTKFMYCTIRQSAFLSVLGTILTLHLFEIRSYFILSLWYLYNIRWPK